MSLERGTVVGKRRARDLSTGASVHVLTLRCHDDAACEEDLVVDKALFDSVCVAGLGRDAVIEYGTVLRVVEPSELDESLPGVQWWQGEHIHVIREHVQQMLLAVQDARDSDVAQATIVPLMRSIRAKLDGLEYEYEAKARRTCVYQEGRTQPPAQTRPRSKKGARRRRVGGA